ncbi:MAG: polyribonucleotide nucleotidyltransferase [Candidatus Abawacabacteria bacterium]|nr:polyribonucleotide nucleotidyltransferase [Candidatus Abawacabacteria bacterium]
MSSRIVSTEFAGRTLQLETGEMAKLANGSVLVRYGDVVILAAATVMPEAKPDIDFFPLLVDYEERFYAAGKIKGSRFMKREGRPSDAAVLAARLIDRPIRPLFPKGFVNDTQVICTVLSADGENDPAIIALIGASCAMSLAGLPFSGPVGGVRIGLIDGNFITNPTYEQIEASSLDLVVAGTADAIMMVEAGAKQVDEETMVKALDFAHSELKKTVALQNELLAQCNVTPITYTLRIPEEQLGEKCQKKLYDVVKEMVSDEDANAIFAHPLSKEIDAAARVLKKKITDQVLALDDTFSAKFISEVVEGVLKKHLRKNILVNNKRPDGRGLTDIRPISARVSLLPRTHGSALFNRGETQGLTIATIGSKGNGQMIDDMDMDYTKHYMHHYNFPSYSVGDVRPSRGPGRREIGHGYLAEKALVPVLPALADFPYAIRVVTEILGSNGSTSMAAVCGSTLSLMDAGVPIAAPIAGVAMGLMTEPDGTYKVLTDIRDLEDFGGDMDFKVAGSATGITALQMDIKVKGITIDIMRDAIAQAKVGRLFILGKMLEVLPTVRPEMSRFAPRVITLKIHPDQIRDVIGSGGKIINEIIDSTGVEIDIEDDGTVLVSSNNEENMAKAVEWIKRLTFKFEIGDVFEGKVTKIIQDRMSGKEVGVLVEKVPGRDGMVHISELADRRINTISEVCKVGDMLKVVVLDVDPVKNRVSLSHKEYLKRFGTNG